MKINGKDKGLVINSDDFPSSGDLASLKPPINTHSVAAMKKGPKGKKR
jgi:hypothetical protein